MTEIKFEIHPYKIDFELCPPITVIKGHSGSGKSLFLYWMNIQKRLPENKDKYSNIIMMNQESDIRDILGKQGKLFIIDNADVLFKDVADIIEHIASDRDNNYLIMCRRSYDFDISPNHFAIITENSGVFTLHYRFTGFN